MNFRIPAAGLLALAFSVPVLAAYPEKPIEVIVPWPAGVGADIGARVLTSAMSKRLGVPVQVINRPGGQAVIGTADLTRAKPDGYTIGSINIGPALTQVIAGNASYKTTDLEPIGLYNSLPFLLVARSDAPFKTFAELLKHAKTASKPLVLGNFGPGAVPTQTIYRMAASENWTFKAVTFPSPTFNQLQAGDADLLTVEFPVIAGQIKAGQARGLVALTTQRIPGAPDVPTVKELGYNFDVSIWTGLFAPKGTPKEVITKLTAVLKDSLEDPAVKDFAEKSGILYHYTDPDATRARIALDEAGARPIMEKLGLIKK